MLNNGRRNRRRVEKMKKKNILKLNDDSRRVSVTYKDAHDRAPRTTIAGKRGRPPSVLPSPDVLTPWLKEALSNPSLTTTKLRAYEILWKECNYSFTCLKRFLAQYLPHAVRDEKTLKKYVLLSKAMQEAIDVVKNMNTKDLISREELELLIYTYLKQKLKKCVRESNEGFFGFSWNGTIEVVESEVQD